MKEKPPLQLSGAEEAPENISTDLDHQLDGIIPVQPHPGFKSSISGQGDESQEPSLLVEPSDYDAYLKRPTKKGTRQDISKAAWMLTNR